MKYTDIAIIGGGLAGSTAAVMLGRAGVPAVLVDPHRAYPPDFRIEKLGGHEQIARLQSTGLADAVLRRATHDGVNWIARYGVLLDKPPSLQFGIMYDDLVNTIRAEIPDQVETIVAKAASISASADRQRITLSNGERISARLAVIANGLNVGLRHALGIERKIVSRCHSVSIGFDLVPLGRAAFPFPALTYFSERPADRIPYITLFPIGSRMRANLFVYREADDPWLRELRRAPVETLNAALPRLKRLTGAFGVAGEIKIRPADLQVNSGYRRPGIVLVGDAFRTTCPVTGTGSDKVFTDVERLCNVHIPAWLATEGMDEAKMAAFYDDPVKTACDAWSEAKAYNFRKVSIDNGLHWRAQRLARFSMWFAKGQKRRLGNAFRRPRGLTARQAHPAE
ncbi:NAD(P)/FAD-dependent oxidoreductase [Bradyrhizobium sp.]|jgi:2-polyprenyl-6-methoxyphenol hydroxylase-like FAD-dependent oxidoreductase|uniref:FAD-dependent oxidoreductase n=1 Tax=Bradyrhizobium sp. TaxID=376 RepID=UPI002B84BBCC|nr:NAD(P)/FAD-dependent oxidoreductase [Bradyrhizobium sp.]HWX57634.1 NAD(P)/FAD-dependent oxidoreductase [Bradyrhizobium sp.]